jgi:hypothetical protein
VNPPGIDARLLEVLGRASSLELFQLNAVIERMLADPKRIAQIRLGLNLGQTVRFLDWRNGQMRTGKVVAMKDAQVTIHEDGTRSSWAVPYAALEPPAPGASRPASPPDPSPQRATRNDFRCGEKVAFEDKYGSMRRGAAKRRAPTRQSKALPGHGGRWPAAASGC